MLYCLILIKTTRFPFSVLAQYLMHTINQDKPNRHTNPSTFAYNENSHIDIKYKSYNLSLDFCHFAKWLLLRMVVCTTQIKLRLPIISDIFYTNTWNWAINGMTCQNAHSRNSRNKNSLCIENSYSYLHVRATQANLS